MLGTSLGVALHTGQPIEGGHRHHMIAINTIRRAGSLRAAVEQGILREGVMYECVRNNVEMVLAGSVRDDGPLPDVITDMIQAQRKMRAATPRRRIGADDFYNVAFDCDRQYAPGIGQSRGGRYQPGGRDQVGGSWHVSSPGTGHRCGIVHARVGGVV